MPADKDYDKDHPDDGSGMAPRACTDIFCLLIFLAFCSGMSYVTHFGVKNGNPKRLTHGFDYNGSLCGVDEIVKDKPLLYYCPTILAGVGVPTGLNLKAPVCVSACPTDANTTIKCIMQSSAAVAPTGTVNHPAQAVTLSQTVVDTVSYATNEVLGLYCVPDLQRLSAIAQASNVPVPAGLRDSLFSSTGPIGKNSVKVQQVFGSLRRCWPLMFGSLGFAVILGYVYLFLLKTCARPLIYLVLLSIILSCFAISGFFFIGETMDRPTPIAGNSTVAPPLNVTAATAAPAPVVVPAAVVTTSAGPALTVAPLPGAALVVTPAALAPVVTSAPLVPAAVVVTAAPTTVTVAAAAASAVRRLSQADEQRRLLTYEEACMRAPAACEALDKRWNEFGGRKKWEEANPYYNEHLSLEDAKTATLVTAGVFAVLGLIFLILLCCAHNAINTATGCVEAATEAIFSMPCMLVMPAVEMLIKAVLLTVLLVLLAYLVSAGEMDSKTYATIAGQEVHGLRRSFKYTDEQKGYIGYYVFGVFWFLELANALGAFVVSYAVVGWYYTPKPKNHNWCGLVWGYVYGLTFHLGSLALGSCLIAICRFIRLIMMYVEQSSKAEGNVVMQTSAKCVACCITCFKKFIEMINKNAYIDICITSNNFCGAAGDVMAFLVSHPAEITILNGACTIFAIGGTALISGLTGYVTYLLCTTQERYTLETSPHHVASPFHVACVAAFGGAFVAHAFMVIFDHTADTLLYTYCWNKSKAHNTVQKYAPDSLSKLTGYAPISKPAAAAAPAAEKPAEKSGFFSMFSRSSETSPLISPK